MEINDAQPRAIPHDPKQVRQAPGAKANPKAKAKAKAAPRVKIEVELLGLEEPAYFLTLGKETVKSWDDFWVLMNKWAKRSDLRGKAIWASVVASDGHVAQPYLYNSQWT